MTQPGFVFAAKPLRFDGADIQPQDHARLAQQMARVYAVLSRNGWWSVEDIATSNVHVYGVRDPEPSISAQIRNLRKARFGGHVIERKRFGNLTRYRLVTS